MPNWCSTDITITGGKKQVEFLHNKIEEWTSKNAVENGFGKYWLGNILINSGVISAEQLDKVPHPRCRGSLGFSDLNTDTEPAELYIQTETAWSPMLQMWVEVLKKYNLDLEIIYTATECGCELYLTNDPCLSDKYVIDVFDDIEGVESDYEATEQYVIELLRELLYTNEKDIKRLMRQFYKAEVSEKMSIHPWEYAEIEELD